MRILRGTVLLKKVVKETLLFPHTPKMGLKRKVIKKVAIPHFYITSFSCLSPFLVRKCGTLAPHK